MPKQKNIYQEFWNEFIKQIHKNKFPFEYKIKNNFIEAFYNDFRFKLSFHYVKDRWQLFSILFLPTNLLFFKKAIATKFNYSYNKQEFYFIKKINLAGRLEHKGSWKILFEKFQKELENLFKIYKISEHHVETSNIKYEQIKISKINLKQINQFKNLELDLTYPKGHKKAGQPLDKICLIGQNGTGKTSIFKIIKAFITENQNSKIFNKDSLIDIEYFEKPNSKTIHSIEKQKFNHYGINIEKNLIHFPADIIDKSKDQNKSVPTSGIIDFDIYSAIKTWDIIKEEIVEYHIKEKIERDKIVNVGFIASSKKLLELSKKFDKWKENHPSPLEKLANECLDSYFEKFNLKIKTDIDFSDEKNFNNIKIETLQAEHLGNLDQVLSTGTKQVLLTAMPLFTLKPKNAIILFDEPERSLYPDVQKDIIDFYTSLSSDSQFFFATHSPIIASCFEPCEIVELEFNENGKIQQKKWFKGERHIDNYFKDAQYMSWDDIFIELFGLKQDGNIKRKEKLREVISLKLNLEKNNFSENERTDKYKEYKKLAQLTNYNFGK